MPTYKLSYFNGRGRAELTRWIFAQAGVPYEDVRLEGDQWAKFKPKTPFGQLPCLEVDGVMICQSNAVAKFVAKKTGLVGKSDVEEARSDMMVDCVDDMLKPVQKIAFTKDTAEKAASLKEFNDKKADFLGRFEKFLSDNKSGYLVGSGLTWADFALVLGLTWVDGVSPIDYTKYPLLKKLNTKVTSEPKIAAWIAKRPETSF